MEFKIFRCKVCGKIIFILNDTSIPTVCCGEIMTRLIPGSTDGAVEKHVPVITKNRNNVLVMVGSQEHPMTEEHHIEWIALVTKKSYQFRKLQVGQKPAANFTVSEKDDVIEAFCYCNLHSLWVSDNKQSA